MIVLLIMVGLLTIVGVAAATPADIPSPFEEVLYLTDTSVLGDGISALYRVEIDEANGRANLTLLPSGVLNLEHVDVLAATPDGARLYFLDDGPPRLYTEALYGYYDVASASVHMIGAITVDGNPQVSFDQAAFSPDGVLYAANTATEHLYELDTASPIATDLGEVVNQATGMSLNLSGADIAFTADGEFFLWINLGNTGAPRGLYTVSLPANNGVIDAHYIGTSTTNDSFTGIAFRANGFGDMVASSTDDRLHIHSKIDGDDVTDPLDMYLDGAEFNSFNGDMSNGPLVLCTRAPKYWLSNSWEGATVSILGATVDEALWHDIFQSATAGNFSYLFMMLTVSELNTNDATGIPIIDEIEGWMAGQDLVNSDGTLNWDKPFDSNQQRDTARNYVLSLVQFTKSNVCR
jgi:hypothetical protein